MNFDRNSEIDTTHVRSSRHYVRLGREASPLLPWIGSPDLNESCTDLFDFDFGADAQAGAPHEDIPECSALDEIDMSDLDRILEGALAGFDAGSRSSSVWEDGEKYWHPPGSGVGYTAPVDITPVKKAVETVNPSVILMTPTQMLEQRLQMPLAPSSIMKTPRSLYDSDGFLRT